MSLCINYGQKPLDQPVRPKPMTRYFVTRRTSNRSTRYVEPAISVVVKLVDSALSHGSEPAKGCQVLNARHRINAKPESMAPAHFSVLVAACKGTRVTAEMLPCMCKV